jgi:SAM-dependent methyltransferase
MDEWVEELLADPVTKQSVTSEHFTFVDGVPDARVFLKSTYGFESWESGQSAYETWESDGSGYANDVARYRVEIEYDRPTYEIFRMEGAVLDIGGGAGTVREFLDEDTKYVSVDPFISILSQLPASKVEAYDCLKKPLNFIAAMAEFLPFQQASFDWVHMRSMLDHVQVADLALLEARRVLVPEGFLLVGIHVEGGRSGDARGLTSAKERIKQVAGKLGVGRWQDNHIWHPTYLGLVALLKDNGFQIVQEYWQPQWQDSVVYVLATPSPRQG